MYFPGDPLFCQDPIFNSVRDPSGRRADDLRASTSSQTVPEWALGYEFDIVLRGREATPDGELRWRCLTPSQTVGPFFAIGLPFEGDRELVVPDDAGRGAARRAASSTARASRCPTR